MPGKTQTANIFVAINATAGAAPDWIMVLPAGATIKTVDGRGPYHVADAAQLIADSLQAAGGKLAVDENHSTDLAAPQGAPSPARGWIDALEVREGAIWGHVTWTSAGRALMSEGAYRGISPVIVHLKDGTIIGIQRVSLTNVPNLHGMAVLHHQGATMDLLAQLRTALGLSDTADETAVLAKVKAMCTSASANAAQLAPIAKAAGLKEDADGAAVLSTVTALMAAKPQLAPIAKALGLKDDADFTTVLNAVTTLAKGAPGAEQITALQGELRDITTRFTALQSSIATDKATAFVDAAIQKGRVGVKPMREHYIARHATDAASALAVEKEINAMPILGPGALPAPPIKIDSGEVSLSAEQQNAAKVLGLDPKAYAKTLATEQAA